MGTYDPARRRRAVRKGNERGVWVFIPSAELLAATVDDLTPLDGPPPYYRLFSNVRRRVIVQFYDSE